MVVGRAIRYRVQGFAAVLFLIAVPHAARAQEIDPASAQEEESVRRADSARDSISAGGSAAQESHWRSSFTAWRKDAGVLLPLYSGFAGLQALDVQSTTRAISHGAVEQNAMMSGVSNHPLALTMLKAATTASTVYAIEHVRKKHRIAAIVTMVAADAAYAIIVVHNYRSIR